MRLPRLTFVPENKISARRRGFAAVLTVAAVLLSSWGDFFGVKPNWPGIILLLVISLAAAFLSTVAFSSARLTTRRDRERISQNLSLLRRSARTIPQRRQAPVLSDYRGRTEELRELTKLHARLRRERGRRGSQTQHPVVLAIHGPPGVGKSALAHALSRRLQKEYPDGLYVASFGTGGTARGPADIARDLLLQLGWPEKDMQIETEDRVATLRSLTRGKRMLFLFDAARDHDQVSQVMPSEPGCLVIVTSRREIGTSLGLPARRPIGPLSLHDGLEMLSAVAGVDWTTDAETAVEVVEMCGRLPLAIRSAAERVRDGQGLRYVAASLRPPRARLAALDYGGRSIRARIDSEFERLSGRQRQALTLLASLDAESFVPWVLRPLMKLEHGESTTIVSDLAAAQFVEEDGQDHTGQARYRIHPLMRLYAMQRQDDADVVAAGQRFDEAYIELIDEVLSVQDPTYELIREGPRVWRSADSAIAARIVESLDHIVRREYLNLVRVIRVADPQTHARMIWRVAALLDGRTPAFPQGARTSEEQLTDTKRAFDKAAKAAHDTGSAVGEVDVRLAQAQFLIAVERYRAAMSTLDTATTLIDALAPPHPGEATALRLRAARVRAWLYIEVGSYRLANAALREADLLLEQFDEAAFATKHVQTDLELIRQFNEDIHRVAEGRRWTALPGRAPSPQDIVAFHAERGRTEELRRRGFWDNAAALLRELLGRDGDARSHTSIHYRLALLQVEHALYLDDRKEEFWRGVVREAVQHAAACIVTFGAIGDPVGQIRGRALLVRALVLAGNLVSATQLDIEVKADLDAAQRERRADIYLESLTALYHQAHADVEIAHGRVDSAWRSLIEAVQGFRRLHDWSSHADAWRLLHEVYPKIARNQGAIEHTHLDRARDRDTVREERRRRTGERRAQR